MLKVKVAAIRDEAIEVRSFSLTAVSGQELPEFSPGAHVEVEMPNGVRRAYSLCGDRGNLRNYLIAVRLQPDSTGGSKFMHEDVRLGTELQITEPRNNFELKPAEGTTLLLAAGIGITPLMSMADTMHESGRSFQLHYFARSLEHTAFRESLIQSEYADRVQFHWAVDPAHLNQYLSDMLRGSPPGASIYTCGPNGFMDAVSSVALGIVDSVVYKEAFGPIAPPVSASEFDVVLARSGRTLRVHCDSTILETLKVAGISVPTVCRQGYCGTCVVEVRGGVPDHRDTYLDEDEKASNELVCVCVSRSKTSMLILDI